MGERRWDPCISHRDEEAERFIVEYFADDERQALLIAGAGFDPRSRAVATLLAAAARGRLRALLLREDRPDPPEGLVQRAAANTDALLQTIANSATMEVAIFGADGAVTGGRNVIMQLSRQRFEGVTDVVIDASALSVGTSFPIVRYFVERAGRGLGPANIHLFVAHDPSLDASIRPIPSDAPGHVHGFKGGSTLDGSTSAARLWLPQLATGRGGTLGRLFNFVAPHDTCPILPFPASDPRLADALAEEYLGELENTWAVDTRNILYADEADPLDLYRTILRLNDLRKPVFAGAGGSLLVLSPVGSKIMALGALLAAIEHDLPVAHLEAIGYELDAAVPSAIAASSLFHIWLEGEAYAAPRSALQA